MNSVVFVSGFHQVVGFVRREVVLKMIPMLVFVVLDLLKENVMNSVVFVSGTLEAQVTVRPDSLRISVLLKQ